MLCSSFSKTLAPGYRVGWTAPGRFHDKVEQLKFVQTLATPTLPQMALAEFMESGGYEHHLRQLRRRLALQVERVSESIAEHFPQGTRVSRPSPPQELAQCRIHELVWRRAPRPQAVRPRRSNAATCEREGPERSKRRSRWSCAHNVPLWASRRWRSQVI